MGDYLTSLKYLPNKAEHSFSPILWEEESLPGYIFDDATQSSFLTVAELSI